MLNKRKLCGLYKWAFIRQKINWYKKFLGMCAYKHTLCLFVYCICLCAVHSKSNNTDLILEYCQWVNIWECWLCNQVSSRKVVDDRSWNLYYLSILSRPYHSRDDYLQQGLPIYIIKLSPSKQLCYFLSLGGICSSFKRKYHMIWHFIVEWKNMLICG